MEGCFVHILPNRGTLEERLDPGEYEIEAYDVVDSEHLFIGSSTHHNERAPTEQEDRFENVLPVLTNRVAANRDHYLPSSDLEMFDGSG